MHAKHDVFEFPEDNQMVHTNMDDYKTELLEIAPQTNSSNDEDPPNCVFQVSLLFFGTAATSLCFAAFLFRFSPFIGSSLSFVTILILREWNRIYGSSLSQQIRVSIRYSLILKDHKDFIPSYDMDWLFGNKYKPYTYGCTGPQLNYEMERTPNDTESRSPTKERTDEKLQKDD